MSALSERPAGSVVGQDIPHVAGFPARGTDRVT